MVRLLSGNINPKHLSNYGYKMITYELTDIQNKSSLFNTSNITKIIDKKYANQKI